MEKVEQYIKEHTKETSNPIIDWDGNIAIYQPWLTPKDTRKAVEIAREEMIERAIKWVEYNNENGGCKFDGWVENIKQAMKDE